MVCWYWMEQDSMAEAVDGAEVVLFGVSLAYKEVRCLRWMDEELACAFSYNAHTKERESESERVSEDNVLISELQLTRASPLISGIERNTLLCSRRT